MRIIAVDPGKTVGIALYRHKTGEFRSMEMDRWDAIGHVNWHARNGFIDVIVCESFTPRPGVRTWQTDALEIIGTLRWIAHVNGLRFILQSPAAAKRFATNGKLASMGWRNRTPGGHADDAARHLLVAAVELGEIDPARFV